MKRKREFAEDYTFALEDSFNFNINNPNNVTINGIPILTSSTGVFSVGPIGSVPNANALSIHTGILNAQPANASFGGVVTTGAQTFAGTKTFSSIVVPSVSHGTELDLTAPIVTINGNVQVPITASNVGSAPNSEALTVSGFNLTLQPTDGLNPGVLTTGAQTIGGLKTYTAGIITPTIHHPVELDITAPIVTINGNTIGPLTVGAFSGTSSANVATVSGNVITLHAADAVNPGCLTTGTQEINGTKTFDGGIVASTITSLSSGTTSMTLHATTVNINGTLDAQTINDGIGITVTTPTLAVVGNETVSGTLGITGATTLTILTTSGLATLNSASVTTTLGVTGATTLSTVSTSGLATLNSASVTTTLGVTGATTLITVSTSGLATLNSASVTTTLGVTGATTLSTASTSGLATLNSASVTTTLSVTGNTTLSTASTSGLATLNSASVTTTLGVTGATTLSTASTSGLATLNSASVTTTLSVTGNTTLSTVSSSGLATLNSASVTTTLGVTGATTLSTASTSGLATLNSASVTTTLSVTGNTTLSTASTSGLATLNSASVTTTLGVTGATTLSTASTSGLATLNSASVTTTLSVTGNTSLSTASTSGLATLNSLSCTNSGTVGGSLTVTGLSFLNGAFSTTFGVFSTTGGTAAHLDYYENTTQAITFTAGTSSTGSLTLQIQRIGSLVSIRIPAAVVAFTSGAPFTGGTNLSTQWRPVQTLILNCFVINGSLDVQGSIQIATTGAITIGVGVPPGNYTSSNIGWNNAIIVNYLIV